MNKDYVDSCHELFSDLMSVTPDRLQAFMGQTMGYLSQLQMQLTSTDLETQAQAFSAVEELQHLLLQQLERVGGTVQECSALVEETKLKEHKQ